GSVTGGGSPLQMVGGLTGGSPVQKVTGTVGSVTGAVSGGGIVSRVTGTTGDPVSAVVSDVPGASSLATLTTDPSGSVAGAFSDVSNPGNPVDTTEAVANDAFVMKAAPAEASGGQSEPADAGAAVLDIPVQSVELPGLSNAPSNGPPGAANAVTTNRNSGPKETSMKAISTTVDSTSTEISGRQPHRVGTSGSSSSGSGDSEGGDSEQQAGSPQPELISAPVNTESQQVVAANGGGQSDVASQQTITAVGGMQQNPCGAQAAS
ncbi:hypothetical protein, partial [Arthrobacter pigmenti]